jgi:hypothetical protein
MVAIGLQIQTIHVVYAETKIPQRLTQLSYIINLECAFSSGVGLFYFSDTWFPASANIWSK